MSARLFPYLLLLFIVMGATGLSAVIFRNPDTHGHLWDSLPDGYGRTPTEAIGRADLTELRAALIEFSFPPTPPQYLASTAGTPAEGIQQPNDEVQKVTLTQVEFGFEPTDVQLRAGVPVELTVINEGDQVHGVWIPDFAISEEIRSGKERVFTFTPDKAGRIRYTCSYNLCGTDEEHARMVGFFIVQ